VLARLDTKLLVRRNYNVSNDEMTVFGILQL
jgi:hypothetical protein